MDPAKREAILGAAREVFLRDGYDGARISEVASRAGVATGTVYLYFASKQELARALAEGFFEGLGRLLVGRLTALEGPGDVAGLVDAVVGLAAQERAVLGIAHVETDPGDGPLARRPRLRMVQALAEILAAQMDRGVIRRFDASVFADLLLVLIGRVVMACVAWGEGDLGRYRPTVIAMIQALLFEGPPAPGPATRKGRRPPAAGPGRR